MNRRVTPLIRITALLIASAALAGCSALDIVGATSERSALESNRAKWQRHRLPAYRFSYERECFCAIADVIVIEVRDEAVIQAAYESSDSPLPPPIQQHLPTVDSLFAIIDRAIAVEADLLRVTYHRVLGYPTRIAIDYRFNMADDEAVHTASRLVPVFDD